MKDGPVYVFDTSTPSSHNGLTVPSIKYCGFYKSGDTINGRFDTMNDAYITDDVLRGYCANMVFASADNDVLEEYAALLNNRDCSFNVVHENELNGSFTAEEDQRILFTIPGMKAGHARSTDRKFPLTKPGICLCLLKSRKGITPMR